MTRSFVRSIGLTVDNLHKEWICLKTWTAELNLVVKPGGSRYVEDIFLSGRGQNRSILDMKRLMICECSGALNQGVQCVGVFSIAFFGSLTDCFRPGTAYSFRKKSQKEWENYKLKILFVNHSIDSFDNDNRSAEWSVTCTQSSCYWMTWRRKACGTGTQGERQSCT